MIIANFADLHFWGAWLEELEKAWLKALEKCIKLNVGLINIAGDIFHHHNIASRDASFGTVREAFERPLRQSNIPTFIVPGQHDQPGPGQIDALQGLEYGSGQIMVARIPGVYYKAGIVLVALPWAEKALLLSREENKGLSFTEAKELFEKKIREVLQYLKLERERKYANKFSILVGHCMVNGANPHEGYVMTDGSYMFTEQELEEIGTSAIVIGDFHKRQSYYVGALTQHGWRDVGNPTGFRVLDVQAGKIVKDEFIEIESKKYFIMDPGEYVEKRAWESYIDHEVRIKGAEEEELQINGEQITLPPGHQIKKEVEKKPIQSRIADLSQNDSYSSLLRKWASVITPVGVDIEKAVGILAEILEELDIPEGGLSGSLSAIKKITLKNIGPHSHLVLDLENITFAGVAGKNGVGKTALIESIPGTFYGDFPSRKGYVYDMVTQNLIGDASMEIDFEASGKIYRALRLIKKTENKNKQECYLFDESGINGIGEPIAGPREKNFNDKIEGIIGSSDLFFSSAFASQFLAKDITSIEPADRQRLLHELLGLQRFSLIAEKAGSMAKIKRENLNEIEANLERVKNAGRQLQEAKGALSVKNKELEKLQGEIETLKEKLLQKKTEKKGFEETLSWRSRLQYKIEELEAEEGRNSRAIEQEQKTIETLNILVAQEAELLEKAKEIDVNKKELENIEVKKRENQETIEKIKEKIHSKEEEIRELERAIEEKRQKLFKEKEDFINQERRIDKKINYFETQILKKEEQLDYKRKALNGNLENSQNKINSLNGVGCAPDFLECFILEEFKKEPERKKQIEEELFDIENTLLEEQFCLNERRELKKLQREKEALKYPDENIGQVELEKIKALRSEIESIKIPEKKSFNESEIKQKIKQLEGVLTKLGEIKGAKNNIEQTQERKKAYQKTLDEIVKELEEKKFQYESIKDPSAQIQNIGNEIVKIEERQTFLNQKVFVLGKEIGSLETNIERFNKENEERLSIEKSIDAKRNEELILSTLYKAFGREGIPQYLIDEAIPKIQAILDELLNELDNKFSIAFSTQRFSKKNVKETLDIMVSDDIGTRPVETFSGGEQKLVKLIIRLAISIFRSQNFGSQFKVFIADEFFDSLDGDNCLAILQMLRALKKYFAQVILISHYDDYLSQLPSLFKLFREGKNTRIHLL